MLNPSKTANEANSPMKQEEKYKKGENVQRIQYDQCELDTNDRSNQEVDEVLKKAVR